MDAFDADVLIYAAESGHPLGRDVAALFAATSPAGDALVGVGSVLLLPEVLGKPLREEASDQGRVLARLLARLDLLPVDRSTAELAVALSSAHRLRAADAVHLATAVQAGADRFLTNNRRDFPLDLDVIEVVYPEMLGDGSG